MYFYVSLCISMYFCVFLCMSIWLFASQMCTCMYMCMRMCIEKYVPCIIYHVHVYAFKNECANIPSMYVLSIDNGHRGIWISIPILVFLVMQNDHRKIRSTNGSHYPLDQHQIYPHVAMRTNVSSNMQY